MNITESYRQWIAHERVRKAILRSLLEREGCALGTYNVDTGNIRVRNVNVNTLAHLDANLNAYRLNDRPVNFYHSVALFQDMPVFSFNPETRKRQSRNFDEVYKMFMKGYDLVVDFDAKTETFRKALKEMRIVHQAFQDLKIPHMVTCSGTGFHLRVQSSDVWTNKHPFHPDKAPEMCRKIVEDMCYRWDLDTPDMLIYDHRRVLKSPFSMDVKTGRIAIPLSQYDIDKFSYNICSPHYVIDTPRIWNNNGFGGERGSFDKWMSSLR